MIHRRILLRLIVICVAVSPILAGCSLAPSSVGQVPPASSSTPSQAPKDPDTVSAKAIIVPYKKATLSFRTAGRVQEVLVSEGQEVKAGQELARLSALNLDQAVLQAEANLKSAQAQRAKAKAGARPEEIAESEAALAIAQAGVQAREATVAVAKGNLKAAQADLDSAVNGVVVARSNLAAAQAKLSSARASRAKVLAGATEIEIKIAEKQVEAALNEQKDLERQRDASQSILEGRMEAARAATDIAQLRLEQLRAGARVEDIAAADAQVDQATAGAQTAGGQVAQAESRVNEAKAAVQTMQAQLAQTEAQLESAKAQVTQAQARLDLTKAGSRAEDISIAEAAVAQAETVLTDATNAREDAILRAPFDGTVGAVLLREGEMALPQTPAIRLGDLTEFRVETEDLSEVDVDQVRVGQEAQITIDALDGKTFKGKVRQLAPVASDRRGDKVYVVTLTLDAGTEDGLRWGMGSFVDIQVR